MMLRKIFLFFISALFSISVWSSGKVFHDTFGHAVSSSSLKGKWVIVNYWASWCAACVQEMPQLNRFYQNNADKNVLFFGFNYDQLPAEELKQTVQTTKIKFPVLIEDPSELWPVGDLAFIPVTVFINPHGKIVKKLVGPSTEADISDTLHNLQRASA